jgi:hypothetical protein
LLGERAAVRCSRVSILGFIATLPRIASAQSASDDKRPGVEFYGQSMLDIGYDFGTVGDPAWADVVRPTKLPAFSDEFGAGGRTFAGVRQSGLGVHGTVPTPAGVVDATTEFDLVGTDPHEGQTTYHLRRAYADWNQLRAGQTWSPFMDIDVFPATLDYWGPNGMTYFSNVQLAWMPIQGDSRVTVALERPDATADTSSYEARIDLQNVTARFPAPDLSAEARYATSWGYIEGAGILRYINWDDLNPAPPDLSGHAWGWGLCASSNVKVGSAATLRLEAVYGEAIENYINDAPFDIGVVTTTNPAQPLEGVALPVLGLTAFADIKWTHDLTTAAGSSLVWIRNSSGEDPEAFHIGYYALANLVLHPTDQILIGGELQFARRENNRDSFAVNDVKLQFSFRFSFSQRFEAKQWKRAGSLNAPQ